MGRVGNKREVLMDAVKTRFYNKIYGEYGERRRNTKLLRRWTILEKGREARVFWSAETAMRCLEVRRKHGGSGLRFGWNLQPAKKAAGRSTTFIQPETAELIENCGVKQARQIMDREGVVNE